MNWIAITYFTVAGVLALAALIGIGFLSYGDDDDDGAVNAVMSILAILAAGLWPFILAVLALSSPFWLGRGIGALATRRAEARTRAEADRIESLHSLRGMYERGSEPWRVLNDLIHEGKADLT